MAVGALFIVGKVYISISRNLHMVESMSEEIEKVVKAHEEVVKTSIALARSLWEKAKIKALKEGLTLTQVVEAALRKYLELSEEEKK